MADGGVPAATMESSAPTCVKIPKPRRSTPNATRSWAADASVLPLGRRSFARIADKGTETTDQAITRLANRAYRPRWLAANKSCSAGVVGGGCKVATNIRIERLPEKKRAPSEALSVQVQALSRFSKVTYIGRKASRYEAKLQRQQCQKSSHAIEAKPRSAAGAAMRSAVSATRHRQCPVSSNSILGRMTGWGRFPPVSECGDGVNRN